LKRAGPISSARLLKGAELNAVHDGVEAYYAAKIARHGAVPLGVDWSCADSQRLRFIQLLKICPPDRPISLIDLGCGYGALADFLIEHGRGTDVEYLGIDLSPDMVSWAQRRHRGNSRMRFASGRTCAHSADYAVASGIMNVKLDIPLATWERFVRTMLVDMHRMSELGFAVNFVRKAAAWSDPGELYCAILRRRARPVGRNHR
jgi:SAM-dependent methyltransferase